MDIFEKCRNFTTAREAMAAGLYPFFSEVESSLGTKAIIDGKEVIMIGSNNYLGLTTHPKVREAAIEAIKRYGSGCTGSRFLNGNLDIHVELENRLAKFMNKQAALVFSTGFQTNLGGISTLVGRNDAVYIDREDHASIVDGCRLAFGKVYRFKHNDMDDLDRMLRDSENSGGKLIAVDGVFSIGGDIVSLPELVKVAKQHAARILVDDAHSIGVLGERGNGTPSHFALEDDVDIVMGTFSKSFASIGGFLAADEDVIHYIKHNCRSLIFSASMPPAAVAAALTALDIIESEPERRQRLRQIYTRMKNDFDALGFDTGNSCTAIIPIKIGENETTFKFWRALLDNGVYGNTIITPAVPPGESLIRTSYMATHSDEELDQVLEVFEKLGKQFNLI
ncbi:pyridoxal phosphate-dependent aminotransferase family protein [bacterium]|nr:pyridoxal phosphate-dependent aminotransferase family protein [bacterium]